MLKYAGRIPVQNFSIKNMQFFYSPIKLCFNLAVKIKTSKEESKRITRGLKSPL
nr:MAG TPA: hypothetical protein [Caudoviricetes sp.]